MSFLQQMRRRRPQVFVPLHLQPVKVTQVGPLVAVDACAESLELGANAAAFLPLLLGLQLTREASRSALALGRLHLHKLRQRLLILDHLAMILDRLRPHKLCDSQHHRECRPAEAMTML